MADIEEPGGMEPEEQMDNFQNSNDSIFEMSEEKKLILNRKNNSTIYVCIYAIFLTTVGPLIYVNYSTPDSKYVSEAFSTCIAVIGLFWLMFLDFDIWNYKRRFNQASNSFTPLSNGVPAYLFLTGRHGESVYLKVGLVAFFFGHLVNEGLMLIQEILNFTQLDRIKLGCGNVFSLIHHLIRIVYSAYQLCIVFKSSNIIINRHKNLARWALMHILASCLCFWFGTILEEALEDFHHYQEQNSTAIDMKRKNPIYGDLDNISHLGNDSYCLCSKTALLSASNTPAMPYLFPFTIEFNILLAGVFFLMWRNIGKCDQKESHRSDEFVEVTLHGHFIIFADFHAAYKGLLAGIFVMVVAVITLILFFVEMGLNNQETAVLIYTTQEYSLTIIALICVVIGFVQLSKLNFITHSTHMDDVLLFIPLPFFFIYSTMTIIHEFKEDQNLVLILLSLLTPLQVVLQTTFIIDSLRKCSNSENLRSTKPGRGVITFLTVCNVTLWFINTFETKSVESHNGQHVHFGQFVWMFICHTTLPFKLFYRFHSSACLADIWESAYNRGH